MPRVRVVSETLYKYEELSATAQTRARVEWSADANYDGSENEDSLRDFEKIFPVKIRDWEYGYHRYVNWTFTGDAEVAELAGVRLMAYLYNNYFRSLFKGKYYSLWSKKEKSPNNPSMGKLKSRRSRVMFDNCCVLTGYWIDQDLLDPIYKFLKKPNDRTTFRDLIGECLESWVYAADKDYESYYSEDNFKDMCEGNEWEFYEDGTMA